MKVLERTLLGTTFQNPLLLAAGTAGYGRELMETIALDALGGIVTKATSVHPRAGNPAPRVAEFRGGMLNSVGLANPGLKVVRERELPWVRTHLVQAKVLVNVVGFRESEYGEVVAGLTDLPGIAAFELNLSCPNTATGGLEFGADPRSVAQVVARCREVTTIPLLAKLSPAVPDLPGLAKAAHEAGAEGVTLVNTMPGWGTSESEGRRLGNGFGGVSGPALLPVGLAAVRRVRQAVPTMTIVGSGGVRSAEDVRSYLAAGADLVAIGTAAMAHPRVPERILRALQRSLQDG